MVAVDHGEGVDEGGAEEGVHVFWQVLALVLSVLGPVGEVAHHLIGRCCMGERKRPRWIFIIHSFMYKDMNRPTNI